MIKVTDDSILMEGIYYTNIDGKLTDLCYIKFNPANKESFDVESLTNQDKSWNKEIFFKILNQDDYFHPFKRKVIIYKERKNVDLLIDVIHNFYSNQSCGIRSISEQSKYRSKLLKSYQKTSSYNR